MNPSQPFIILRPAAAGSLCLLLALAAGPLDAADTPAAKPNVIFYLTDDMGWADPSCYGNTEVKTPNIDRLAAEGVRFTQFYCASPICSPSRTGFTTGMFPARWNITDYLHDRAGNRRSECADWLDPKAPTLARALQQAGYATAHIGKWHMGGGRDVNDAPWPKAYGFDESWTTWEGMGPSIEQDFPGIKAYERTAKFVDKAIDFIKRHKGQPFYLNLWPNEVHDPHIPDPEFRAKYDGARMGEANFDAVLDKYDTQLGRLLDCLQAEGLAGNTIVVFASDNGPNPPFAKHRRTGGLRGMKWSLHEGGIRMPCIVRWPARIPAGIVDALTISGAVDLLPTICALAGVAAPKDVALDGEDLSAAWRGTPVRRTKPLFWEYGRNQGFIKPQEVDRSPNVAMRDGKWKLLINADGTDTQLYDLEADPNESNNLAEMRPAIAGKLGAQALAWRRSLPELSAPAGSSINLPPAKE
jgi:arylsulfatase A-like enzyme